MIVQGKNGFVKLISEFITKEENIVIKPNWVSNEYGEYTEPEILDWLLSIFPTKKTKYVIESYTPWRGLVYSPIKNKDVLDVSLEGGKKYWDFYKEQDVEYLRNTGIGCQRCSKNSADKHMHISISGIHELHSQSLYISQGKH